MATDWRTSAINAISRALAEEKKAGTLNLEAGVTLPAVPTPREDIAALRKTVAAMKQILDAREGVSASVLDKNITLRDLMNEGALSINVGGQRYVGNEAASLSLGSGYIDPRPILTIPPTITDLVAAGAFKNVILRWTMLDYANHAYVEVWRHTSDAIGAATLNGVSTANVYTDASGTVGVTYYYWVRAVAVGGALGAFNAVAGTPATLEALVSADLLDGAVTAAKIGIDAVTLDKLEFSDGTVMDIIKVRGSGGDLAVLPNYLNVGGRLDYSSTGRGTTLSVLKRSTHANLTFRRDGTGGGTLAANQVYDLYASDADRTALKNALVELRTNANSTRSAGEWGSDTIVVFTSYDANDFGSGDGPNLVAEMKNHGGTSALSTISGALVRMPYLLIGIPGIGEGRGIEILTKPGQLGPGAEYTGVMLDGNLAGLGGYAEQRISANLIQAGAIIAGKIAANAVGANELQANSITAGKIEAQAVTTSKLLVTGVAGSLWPDPNYKDTAVWTTSNWGGVPDQQSLSDGVSGSTSMRSPSGSYASARGARRIPVVIGRKYRVSCYARRDATANGTLYLRIDGSTSEVSAYSEIILSGGNTEAQTVGTSWAKYSAEWTATTPFASPMVLLNYLPSSGWLEAQDVRIDEKADASLIVDGAIIAGKIAANAITAGSGIIGTAVIDDAMVANLSAVKITAGYLDAARIDVGSLHANRITANTITAGEISTTALSSDNTLTRNLTVRDGSGNIILAAGNPLAVANAAAGLVNTNVSLSAAGGLSGAGGGAVTLPGLGTLGAFGSGNLCANSDFMVTPGNIPTNFYIYNNGGVSVTYSIDSVGAVGGKGWRIHANAAVSNTFGFCFNDAAACFGGWKAATNYIISFYAAISANAAGLNMSAAWNNPPAVQTWIQNPVLNTSYQRYVMLINFGGNTIDVQGYFTVSSPYTLTSGTDLVFANIQVEQGDSPSGWSAPPLTSTNVINAGNASTYIANAAIAAAHIGSLNADVINAGAIRGINVTAGTLATKGTYLTTAPAANDTTLNVQNTADFHASGGTAIIYDTSNDRDIITYTGKTSTTLTGVPSSGGNATLAHSSGATIMPTINNGTGQQSMVIENSINEMRFRGNRGDGTYEELASIGITTVGSDTVIGNFGSSSSGMTRIAVRGESYGAAGVAGVSYSNDGISGGSTNGAGGRFNNSSSTSKAVSAYNYGAGGGIEAGSDTGYGATLGGNSTKAPLFLTQQSAPSNKSIGSIYIDSNGYMYVADGSAWQVVQFTSGGAPPTCFPAGALVLMADGAWLPIESVKIGDRVWGPYGPEVVVDVHRPVLGNRRMLAFADGHTWSEEHAHWTRIAGAQWWWSANPDQWRAEVASGDIGGLRDNSTMRTGTEGVEFAHLDGWKRNTIMLVDAHPSTQLYLPITGGSPIIVNGYLAGGGVNEFGFNYASLDWDDVNPRSFK